MKWTTAISLARSCEVHRLEWNNLYYDVAGPTEEQLRLCEETAQAVLRRNDYIEGTVVFRNCPEIGKRVHIR